MTKFNIGNVCPTRTSHSWGVSTLAHEPAERIPPVIRPFNWPVKLLVCRHCDGLYTEAYVEQSNGGDDGP